MLPVHGAIERKCQHGWGIADLERYNHGRPFRVYGSGEHVIIAAIQDNFLLNVDYLRRLGAGQEGEECEEEYDDVFHIVFLPGGLPSGTVVAF